MPCYRLNWQVYLHPESFWFKTFLFARIYGLNYLITTILGQTTDSQTNNFGCYSEQEENKYMIVLPENNPLASCDFGVYGHSGHE